MEEIEAKDKRIGWDRTRFVFIVGKAVSHYTMCATLAPEGFGMKSKYFDRMRKEVSSFCYLSEKTSF